MDQDDTRKTRCSRCRNRSSPDRGAFWLNPGQPRLNPDHGSLGRALRKGVVAAAGLPTTSHAADKSQLKDYKVEVAPYIYAVDRVAVKRISTMGGPCPSTAQFRPHPKTSTTTRASTSIPSILPPVSACERNTVGVRMPRES
jgi:hypothetical protein